MSWAVEKDFKHSVPAVAFFPDLEFIFWDYDHNWHYYTFGLGLDGSI